MVHVHDQHTRAATSKQGATSNGQWAMGNSQEVPKIIALTCVATFYMMVDSSVGLSVGRLTWFAG